MKTFFAFSIIILHFSIVKAQDLLVQLRDGNIVTYNLSDLKKITVEGDKIVFYDDQVGRQEKKLSNVVKLNIGTLTFLDDPEIENPEILIFPNPAQGKSNISFAVTKSGRVSVELYDQYGKQVRKKIIESSMSGYYLISEDDHFWFPTLPPGIYICRIEAAGTTTTKRILIIQ